MRPLALIIVLLLAPVMKAGEGEARDDPALKLILALQHRLQTIVRRAEPAVVSLLVSRSDVYQQIGYPYTLDTPGQLGGFQPDEAERQLRKLGLSDRDCLRILPRLNLAAPDTTPDGWGTGVVVEPGDLVLTNYHVVRDAMKVFVRFSGGAGSYADVHAADPRSDLAVVKLLTPPEERPRALPYGNGDAVQRGEFVVCLAHPVAAGGLDGQASVSWGVISNVRRRALAQVGPARERTIYRHGALLEADVRLRAGSSGGALLNMRGELIGLTTALAALQGADVPGGFAIPIGPGLRGIIDTLRRGEEVEYAFLGVGFDHGRERAGGVALSYVTPGSPADRQGLAPQDVVLRLNGELVLDSEDLLRRLSTLLAGATVRIEVRKAESKQVRAVDVRLDKYYDPTRAVAANTRRPCWRGVRVDYASLLVQGHPLGGDRTVIPPGVFVCDVQPDSSAATALLRPGEVITHVNGQVVDSPESFYRLVRDVTGPVELTLGQVEPGQASPKVILN